ncbi:MAG: hypothetical protein WBN16_06805 [Lutimonas sp.]
MAKLLLTHFFLNLYLLAIIQPAIPILDYLLNYNYIANQLCENREKPVLACNGKCYLEKQISKQNPEQNSSIPLPPKIDLEKFLTIKSSCFSYQFMSIFNVYQEYRYQNNLIENISLLPLLRPPSF